MKITDIKVYIIGNPWKNWVFCCVETDEGITGIGEASGGVQALPYRAILEEIKHLCIGENPLDIPSLRDKLKRALNLAEDSNRMHGVSAIDIACWDILGKHMGQPLYKVLGGKARPELRAYANGWYRGERTPESFAEKAAAVVGRGYTALKFDPFGKAYMRQDYKDERLSLDIVAAVRETVGDEVDIIIEGHDRFAVSTAIRLGKALEAYRPLWFESPVISHDINGTLEVSRSIGFPVAVGERFTTTRQFAEMLAHRTMDIIIPETLLVGGVSGLVESFHVAHAFGAAAAPHNAQSPLCTAVNVSVGISQPNTLIQECFDDFQDEPLKGVIAGGPRVANGTLKPTDAPGLGVTFNPEAAAGYEYSPHNVLRLFQEGWERREGERPATEK